MKRALVPWSWLLLSCTNTLPGTPVATYRVVMTLEENTCGKAAVTLTDGKTYSVEVRSDRGRGYWHVADHQPVQGTLDEKRNFTFTASTLVASEGPDAGTNPCRLVQDEVLSGSLRSFTDGDGGPSDGGLMDAGEAMERVPTALVGVHLFQISGFGGTDCTRALMPGGGPFASLPCTVRYRLSGTERDPF